MVGASAWIERLRRPLAPIAVGLITASGAVMARASDHGGAAWIITGLVAAFVVLSRCNLLWALGTATMAGVALEKAGVRL